MASKERQYVLSGSSNCDKELKYHNSLELVQEQFVLNMQMQMHSNSIISPNGPLSYLIHDAASSSNSYTSPLGSDMGLPENQDELLDELTRRMADVTFEDDDHRHRHDYNHYEATSGCGGYNSSRVYDYNHAFIGASKQHSTPDSDPPQNPTADIFSLQKNRMSNKPQVRKEGSGRIGAGGRGIKAAEQKEHRRSSNMQDRKEALKHSGTYRNGSFIIPDMQPLPGYGTGKRVVSSNSVSNGTGVFLPSAIYKKADPQKKPAGCSTVIIPSRVLHTLQQHFHDVGARTHAHNSDSSINHHWQNDVLARINGLLSQKQEQAVFQIRRLPPPATIHDPEEFRLPHEWTY